MLVGQCANSKLTSNFYNAGINYIGNDGNISCTGGGSTFISVNNNISDVLIASGSGGGSGSYRVEYPGGYGGYIGEKSGGTQTQGGSASHYNNSEVTCDSSPGTKLKGGDAKSCWAASSGGGGGGYYGGGGGVDLNGDGGGSSFARGDLLSVTFYNGSETFQSPSGTLERGHAGDGFITIQPILICSFNKMYFNINLSPYLLLILFDSK